MDIFQRLEDDHGKQRGLAAGLLDTSGDSLERRRLFRALKREVEAHAVAEERTFYAALIALERGQPKARHSVCEHKGAADLIAELDELDMASGAWLQKFKALKQCLEHHLDEEEAEVFPLARRCFDAREARRLGDAFADIKQGVAVA